jgi:hypothetical protein
MRLKTRAPIRRNWQGIPLPLFAGARDDNGSAGT